MSSSMQLNLLEEWDRKASSLPKAKAGGSSELAAAVDQPTGDDFWPEALFAAGLALGGLLSFR